MKIRLNGVELSKEATGDLLVGQVLAEVQQEIHLGGKILLAASIDGTPVENGFRRKRQLATPVTRVATLDLMVQESSAVTEQILKDSLQIQQQVATELPDLATSFRIGDECNANQRLADTLDRVMLSLKGAALAMQKGKERSTYYASFNQAGTALMPVLDRVLAAQTAGDYTALADELEYRLPSALRNCQDCMAQMVANPVNCGAERTHEAN